MSPSLLSRLRKSVAAHRSERGPTHYHLSLEQLEHRTLLSGNSIATATPITLGTAVANSLASASVADYYQVTLAQSGRLQILTHASSAALDTRTSLLGSGPAYPLLVQSDGQSLSNPDDQISQLLPAGTYYLRVEAIGAGTGSFNLTTSFVAALLPFESFPVGTPGSVPAGQVNGNFVTMGDFNGDGLLDLATANYADHTVSVLLGNGDGTFQPQQTYMVGSQPVSIMAGHLDGRTDAHGKPILDLVVANYADNTVSVLLGNGDGTFQTQRVYAAGTGPSP